MVPLMFVGELLVTMALHWLLTWCCCPRSRLLPDGRRRRRTGPPLAATCFPCCCSQTDPSGRGKQRLRWSQFAIDPYIRTIVALFIFSYTQFATTTLRYIQCINVDGERVLFTSPAIHCSDSKVTRRCCLRCCAEWHVASCSLQCCSLSSLHAQYLNWLPVVLIILIAVRDSAGRCPAV